MVGSYETNCLAETRAGGDNTEIVQAIDDARIVGYAGETERTDKVRAEIDAIIAAAGLDLRSRFRSI